MASQRWAPNEKIVFDNENKEWGNFLDHKNSPKPREYFAAAYRLTVIWLLVRFRTNYYLG